MKSPLTKRQKELLEIIYHYIKDSGYPPTFEEMRESLDVVSNQSIVDLIEKLRRGEFVRKNTGARSLAITRLGDEVLGRLAL